MRINVYHHELSHMAERSEVVETVVDAKNTFYGVRFYTEPPLMHHDDDDDSSAITLWATAHEDDRGHTAELKDIAYMLLAHISEIDARVTLKREDDESDGDI